MSSTAETQVHSGDSPFKTPNCHPTTRKQSEATALPKKTPISSPFENNQYLFSDCATTRNHANDHSTNRKLFMLTPYLSEASNQFNCDGRSRSFRSRFASAKMTSSSRQQNTSQHPFLDFAAIFICSNNVACSAGSFTSVLSLQLVRSRFRYVSTQTPVHPSFKNVQRIASSANSGFPLMSKQPFRHKYHSFFRRAIL